MSLGGSWRPPDLRRQALEDLVAVLGRIRIPVIPSPRGGPLLTPPHLPAALFWSVDSDIDPEPDLQLVVDISTLYYSFL